MSDDRHLRQFIKIPVLSMRFVTVLLLLLLVGLGIAGGFAYWAYNGLNTPHKHDKADDYITIPRGTSPAGIIDKLQAEGILAESLPAQIYLRATSSGSKLKAGEYRFQSPITPLAVLEKLEQGEERTTRLTVIEGWTRFDTAKEIVKRFPDKDGKPRDEKAILALFNDASLISDFDPTAKNLEGYLYPSTYNFPKETEPKQIVKTLVEQFRKVWKPEWNERARALGRTPRDIVTIASLIETESKIDSERPQVASVIYNRLQKGMALGIDQTFVYVAKMEGKWDGTIHKSDVERDSPYNTRKYAGLPPGPIASASESAFKAALNPASTDYIFYVLDPARNDGSHNFYNNAAGFERGKAAYQAWLAQQRGR